MYEPSTGKQDAKKPLVDRNYFDTSIQEVDKYTSQIQRLGKAIELDPKSLKVKQKIKDEVEIIGKKLRKALKEAKEYMGDKDESEAFVEAENKVKDAMEDITEKMEVIEQRAARGEEIREQQLVTLETSSLKTKETKKLTEMYS